MEIPDGQIRRHAVDRLPDAPQSFPFFTGIRKRAGRVEHKRIHASFQADQQSVFSQQPSVFLSQDRAAARCDHRAVYARRQIADHVGFRAPEGCLPVLPDKIRDGTDLRGQLFVGIVKEALRSRGEKFSNRCFPDGRHSDENEILPPFPQRAINDPGALVKFPFVHLPVGKEGFCRDRLRREHIQPRNCRYVKRFRLFCKRRSQGIIDDVGNAEQPFERLKIYRGFPCVGKHSAGSGVDDVLRADRRGIPISDRTLARGTADADDPRGAQILANGNGGPACPARSENQNRFARNLHAAHAEQRAQPVVIGIRSDQAFSLAADGIDGADAPGKVAGRIQIRHDNGFIRHRNVEAVQIVFPQEICHRFGAQFDQIVGGVPQNALKNLFGIAMRQFLTDQSELHRYPLFSWLFFEVFLGAAAQFSD